MAQIKFSGGALLKLRNTRLRNPRRFNFWWERFPDPRNVTIPWPTHAGYAETHAGRGDGGTAPTIYFVTNLSSSGAGSFRQAITDHNAGSTPSIVLFNVGGICVLTGSLPDLTRGDLTVLGETAPYPGFIMVGDGWTIACTGSLIRHLSILPGRYDDFGGTAPDGRDAIAFGSARDCVFMNCMIGMGTDGNYDFNIGQQPQVNIDTIAQTNMWCLQRAGHSEGAHSRCTNQGARTDHIAYLGMMWGQSAVRFPNIQGGQLTAIVNCVRFDGPSRCPVFSGGSAGVNDSGGTLMWIGNPIAINGPFIGDWGNDNQMGEPQMVDDIDNGAGNTGQSGSGIFYIRDSWGRKEYQGGATRATGWFGLDNAGFTPVRVIDETLGYVGTHNENALNGGRSTGQSSSYSGSDGREMWDFDTGSLMASRGHFEPARWTPLVMGDSSSADFRTGSAPSTVVEEWVTNHAGPRPQDRNLIQLRVFANLAARTASVTGNVGVIDDPRELLLPPGAINSESISLETQFGYTQSMVINEVIHASHSDYPSNPTDINGNDGWPEVYRYVMRNYTQVVEDINGWYQVIEHL